MVFGCAAILMKRTAEWRIDIWRISFVSNLATGVAFQLFLFEVQGPPAWELLWQPAIVAVLFMLGQICTLVSLTEGEISIAAPVLGLKLLFVPFFLWGLGIAILPAGMWVACIVATLAVALLNFTDRIEHRERAWFSLGFAAAGAAAYAMFDVCIQQWVPQWPQGGFLPVMFLMSMALSLALIPLFKSGLAAIPRPAWPWLGGAASLFAVQSLGIVCAIAWYQNAAAANVIYSSRGLWSLGLLAVVGHHLGVRESGLSPRVFAVRLFGALLLMAAIGCLLL